MGERGRVSPGPFRSARRSSGLVTRRARRQLVRGIRRVTLKTTRVRICARRNRKADAAARRFMTARAVRLPQMFGVVEARVKTFQTGKTLDARRRVTNRANR